MDPITFEEIKSTLAKCGRPDLIQELKEHVKIDEDYNPPNFIKKDKYSDTEGSAEEEEEYEVHEDSNGFQSLK
tara:strand:- start:417 stop:635 length:219 start_codon:yes stop_codon:yes gene_type:complete